jgi:ribosome biogenesis GTPase
VSDLRAIGWPYPDDVVGDDAWAAALAAHPGARPARVVEQHRSGDLVAQAPGEAVAVESLPEWQRAAGYRKGQASPEERAAVGDWVLVEGAKIVALLPRHSAIQRGAAGEHYKQQLIAANIDTVFVVCGLDADFNPRRIERYLLLVQGSGAGAVVVLTKADKADGEDPGAVAAALEAISGSLAQEMTAVAVNAKDPATVDVLAPWLQPGSSVVLVGSSGAGKSTLTNTLLGTEKMKTSEVRESDARGRHTTTHRALVPLPSGACLIDTPGMRELKPTGEEDVDRNFTDIEALAEQCRFRDCRHDREPGCAVRAAIEAGTLDPDRYANYLKLRDEVAGAADRLATRLAQKSEAKVLTRALHKRLDEKHGKH